MRLRGAEILIRSLIDHGVDTVFGYPGGQVLDIYDALFSKRRKIHHITTAHEEGACHAADGYARATGKVGVVIATSGPGATNLVTGIATAFLDSIPLVAITGNVKTSLIGKDAFQEVDITGITMPITKYNYIVKDVNRLEEVIDEAFSIAVSGRPGPVLIDIPKDVQRAWCEYVGGKNIKKLNAPSECDDFEEIIEAINEAKKPCIYIGGGVISSGTSKLVREFALKIDSPIVSSMMGLGAIRNDDTRFLGMAGMHGTYLANYAIKNSDLLIAIGSRFSDRAIGDKSDYVTNKTIIHIDIDAAEVDKNIASTYHLVGDIKDILNNINDNVENKNSDTWNKCLAIERLNPKNNNKMDGDFNPEKIISAVSSLIDDDDLIATDVGQHQMWVAEYYPFKKPRTFITSGGLGTMGFGLGAAIGGAIGTKKKAVLFTSDGSFHMNMNELATLATNDLPILIIVFDNHALGMVKQWQHLFYHDRFAETEIVRRTNYKMVADAMGIRGFDASSMAELEDALSVFLKDNKPTLIACRISSEEMVLPMIPPEGALSNIMTRHDEE